MNLNKMKYNIYSGLIGKLEYQETEEFDSEKEAFDRGRDIAAADAEAFGWSLDEVSWNAIPTEEDTIKEEDLVGSKYI